MQVGGGEVEFLTEKFPLRNVPGVLKRQKKNKKKTKIFFSKMFLGF